MKKIAWFTIWLFLLLLALSKSSARKDGFWYQKYSLNPSLFMFSHYISLVKISYKSGIFIFDPLGVEYGVFSDSVGNKLLLKPLRTSSFAFSKVFTFF